MKTLRTVQRLQVGSAIGLAVSFLLPISSGSAEGLGSLPLFAPYAVVALSLAAVFAWVGYRWLRLLCDALVLLPYPALLATTYFAGNYFVTPAAGYYGVIAAATALALACLADLLSEARRWLVGRSGGKS